MRTTNPTCGALGLLRQVSLLAVALTALNAAAAEAKYVKRGLVAWYDGIDNAGVSQHTNAPTAWKDLAGTNDLPVVGELLFEENHGVFAGRGYCYGRAPDLARLIESRTGTIEVVTRIGNYVESTDRHLLSVGFKAANQRGFSLRPNKTGTSVIGCCDYMCTAYNLVALPSTAGEVNTHTVILDGSTLRFAQNGAMSATVSSGNTLEDIPNDITSIGHSEFGLTGPDFGGMGKIFIGRIYSVRFYNRILTAAEIAQNSRADYDRFLARGLKTRMRPSAYSPNDLLAHFDGIENASVRHPNSHAGDMSEWVDLTGENTLAAKPEGTAVAAASNHVAFTGTQWFEARAPRVAAAIQGGTCTVEVVTRIADYETSSDLHMLTVGHKSATERVFSLRPNKSNTSVIGCCDYMCTAYNPVFLPSTANEVNTHTVIMDGNSLRFAQNGARSADPSSRGDLAAGTSDLLSIGSSEIGGKIFKGEVYAVRIYGRVLTDREIALHRAIDLVRFCGRRFADVRPAVLPKGCHLSPDGETVVWGPTGLCVFIY